MSTVTAALWRCDTCGKWSSAARRPRKHQRWVQDRSKALTDREGSFIGYDGEFVGCGPFSGWTAIKHYGTEGESE